MTAKQTLLEEKLEHALRDSISMIYLQSNDCYVIKTLSRVEKIPYKKILLIQRDGKNSSIQLLNGTVSKERKSLSRLYSELDSKDFVYIDRGTIVNLAHIVTIKDGIVELKNGIRLPASHAKLEAVKEKLFDFWGEKL